MNSSKCWKCKATLLGMFCVLLVTLFAYLANAQIQPRAEDHWCAPLPCTGGMITNDSGGAICLFFESSIQTCREQEAQFCLYELNETVYCYGWIFGTTVSCHLYMPKC